ncbi:MAG: 50S ribosomal protein L21 [Deltaproteobacteria bacterium]|jgi:large subunit ribosomal protein L21|nr:50S ribosomal protein L21 [Deltaproteobacteria bacterium]
MYAVIKTGGKQYRVSAGSFLLVEKLEGVKGDIVSFDSVLAVSKEDQLSLGTPFLSGVSVSARIVEQTKGDKVYAFKIRRRKGLRKKVGHRQLYTRVKIEEIKS